MNRGYEALKVVHKGGKKGSLTLHPQTAQHIRDYLAQGEHKDDLERPLVRPGHGN
jgi:hypothetical protein